MTWARSKLLIWDYLFQPVKVIRMNYVGKNPDRFYEKIVKLALFIFNIPETYMQEREFTWEKGKETERFDILWDFYKKLDIFSHIIWEVRLTGFVSNGEGKASIVMSNCRLITEYPQDTLWQKSFVYEFLRRMWHRLFYHHKRMQWLSYGKELTVAYEQGLKKFSEELQDGQNN